MLCFVVVMQSFIMNSHEVFIHIHQGCFAGTGAIVRLPQCQWSKPDGYGKISQCITTTKHSKAKTVCIFLGIYCISYAQIQQKCENQLLAMHLIPIYKVHGAHLGPVGPRWASWNLLSGMVSEHISLTSNGSQAYQVPVLCGIIIT